MRLVRTQVTLVLRLASHRKVRGKWSSKLPVSSRRHLRMLFSFLFFWSEMTVTKQVPANAINVIQYNTSPLQMDFLFWGCLRYMVVPRFGVSSQPLPLSLFSGWSSRICPSNLCTSSFGQSCALAHSTLRKRWCQCRYFKTPGRKFSLFRLSKYAQINLINS